jgi:hypothetical protein
VSVGPLPSTGPGADHMENTSSNTFSIVVCAYFGRCLEMGLNVTVLYPLSSVFGIDKGRGLAIILAASLTE